MVHEIHEPDPKELKEGQAFHTVIGQDPWLEEFARSPYDPLNSARATGRLTGLAARHVFRKGWMRVVAFLIGLSMVGGSFGLVAVSVTSGMPVSGMITANLGGLLISIPGMIVGARLIVHALRK